MSGSFIFLAASAIVVLTIISIVLISGLKGQMESLNRRVMQLSRDLKSMSAAPATNLEAASQVIPPEQVAVPVTTVSHQVDMFTETVAETIAVKPAVNPETAFSAEAAPVSEPAAAPDAKPAVEENPLELEHITGKVNPAPAGGFNFERFIGENLINKIGIGVLVIGVGLFVKYAIDNDWLNEAGRTVIGFMSGGVLLALAYRFHRTYRTFSSVLAGGAVAVFYLTVAIAFREYRLFGQTGSFLMMVAITAFSVWLSILYDRRELAILSLVGGMLTPFMVSRGDGNYHALFTYMAVLNAGMLTLSLRKQWKELLIISFVGTQLIFWLYFLQDTFNFSRDAENNIRDSFLLIYAGIFYIIFLLMPLVQVFRSKEQTKDHALHVIILIANSFFCLLVGILLLKRMDGESYRGLLTALLAVVNAVMAAFMYSNRRDRVLFHLFTGLTVSFITLAAPMQFDGSSITLFWATEAVLLLWLFRKSGTFIYYICSLVLLLLALISVWILHSLQVDKYMPETAYTLEDSIFMNRYFITRLYVSLAFIASGWLLRRCRRERKKLKHTVPVWLSAMVGAVAAAMLFYTGSRELYMYTSFHYAPFWGMAYFFVFACILSYIIKRPVSVFRFISMTALWAIGCLWYWFHYSGMDYPSGVPHALPVVLYWIGFAGLCGLSSVFAHTFYARYSLRSASGKTVMCIFNAASIISLSVAAVDAIDQVALYSDAYISNKATVTILWSLCAFVQMWLGMYLKYKPLRIISLSLLGLVLCKLFLHDLSNVSHGARIAAFVVLGVVLLVLSFLYQKLRKILFENE